MDYFGKRIKLNEMTKITAILYPVVTHVYLVFLNCLWLLSKSITSSRLFIYRVSQFILTCF